MSGKSSQRNLSKVFQTKGIATALELLLISSLGFLTVVLHARLRIPMGLPGRHGIEFMTLFVLSRQLFPASYHGSIFGLGAALASFFPFIGIKDPVLPFVFFTIGIVFDLICMGIKSHRYKNGLIVLVAGVCYAIIPFIRELFAMFTSFPYEFLRHGYALPLLSHFAFGAIGGLIGLGIYKGTKSMKKSTSIKE